ncbi:MAG TPA: glycerate-2-kinase family protein, partial [Rhodothermales bacterium]|nr:glycerate-2-kinase family protein [Rhodothermales bacterium]
MPLTQDAIAIFDAAVAGVQPHSLLKQVTVEEAVGSSLARYHRVVVVGAGKASMAMAGAVEEWMRRPVDEGLVVVPHGYRHSLPESARRPRTIEVVEAGHPKPDPAGVSATRRVLDLAQSCTKKDLLLVLLSGGGSSLWPAFADAIPLEAGRQVFVLLLHSGADIHETNTVRKHLSRISGGQLVAVAAPATVRALVLSDVVGDDLSVIASGPTVPDGSTFDEAVAVLRKYALWERIPGVVRQHLEAGQRGEVAETPGRESRIFNQAYTRLIGSNRDAL